jgi:hypothetical protein
VTSHLNALLRATACIPGCVLSIVAGVLEVPLCALVLGMMRILRPFEGRRAIRAAAGKNTGICAVDFMEEEHSSFHGRVSALFERSHPAGGRDQTTFSCNRSYITFRNTNDGANADMASRESK